MIYLLFNDIFNDIPNLPVHTDIKYTFKTPQGIKASFLFNNLAIFRVNTDPNLA